MRTPPVPYTGPVPSRSSRLAPWVMLAAVLAAIGNAAQLVLNLVERHFQQEVGGPNQPASSTIRHTISQIHTAGWVTVVAGLAFAVIGTIWSFARRSRARVRVEGERGVEPALAAVSPIAYRGALVALAVVILLGIIASNTVHAGSTSTDFARYRGYLALRAAIGVAMWVFWVKAVVTATRLQERREAYAASLARTPPAYP